MAVLLITNDPIWKMQNSIRIYFQQPEVVSLIFHGDNREFQKCQRELRKTNFPPDLFRQDKGASRNNLTHVSRWTLTELAKFDGRGGCARWEDAAKSSMSTWVWEP